MAKTLVICFLFVFSYHVLAQKYYFDYMLKAEHTRNDSKIRYSTYDMVNSQNKDIYMQIAQYSLTLHFSPILIDRKKRIIHRFDLGPSFTSPLNFIYYRSNYYKNKEFIKYKYLKIEKINDLHYRVIAKKDANTDRLNFEFIFAPFEVDLLIFRYEPLSIVQENEIEDLLKKTLISDGKIGNFYIKEFIYKFSNFQSNAIIVKPEKIEVNLDLSKININYD